MDRWETERYRGKLAETDILGGCGHQKDAEKSHTKMLMIRL
jgi:hypothetical protein